MNATRKLAAVFFGIALPFAVCGQNKPSAPTPNATTQNVYFHSWDIGEIKDCETYSGHPYLLVCDGNDLSWKGSFLELIGDNAAAGMTKEEAYHRALVYSTAHSKKFLVSFSREPWPKPQEGIKMTMWDCTKKNIITCKFGGREK
jgi:hypothetical protein